MESAEGPTDRSATSRGLGDLRWWTEKLALATFLGLGAYYLVAEHRAHVFGILPYAVLLLCPLMHLFMHHGHRHGAGDHQ